MSSIKVINVSSSVNSVFYNFSVDQHIETRREINKFNDAKDFKKADFNFVYQEYIKKYEEQIATNRTSEEDLISFYDILDYDQVNNISKNVDLRYFFDQGLNKVEDLISSKKTYIFEENRYFDYLSKTSLKKDLPYYTHIKFDKINGDLTELSDLLDEYKLKSSIIQEYAKTNRLVRITESSLLNFISDNNSDMDFYIKFNNFKTKYKVINPIESTKTPFEVIGYKITKYYGSTGFTTPVQEWYLPAINSETYELIDSQIIYGTNYFYSISLIVVSIAAFGDNKDITDLVITEVLSTGYESRLVSNPPLKPEAFFIPIIDKPNTIKVMLNSAIGRLKEEPVRIILPEDAINYETFFGTSVQQEKIVTFESLSPHKNFQIMRLDYEPKSFSDFSDGEIILTDTGVTCFEDEIDQNKKYYYIFRSVDVHNHISNPTEIFTVEIIQDAGVFYPVFGVHTIKNIETLKEPSKSFKKFFSFTPQISQITSDPGNYELSGKSEQQVLENITVGSVSPTLWGKKFKIRVTSISTGRKIDINVKFNKS